MPKTLFERMSEVAKQAMTTKPPQAGREARELLAAEFPEDHSQWGPIRRRILEGSVGIHSDGVSAMAAAALRAIDKALSRNTTEDEVERVARAIFEEEHRGLSNCLGWDDCWEDGEHHRERYRRNARAAISAMTGERRL